MTWTFVTDPAHVMAATGDYFNDMTSEDLHARGVDSIDAYKEKYLLGIHTFLTPGQVKKIDASVAAANDALKPYKHAAGIPWKIAVLGNGPEDGYPHTFKDIIVLTDRLLLGFVPEVTKTLIHEKVHVFQRMYPAQTHVLLLNRLKMKVLFMEPPALSRVRSNPDKNRMSYGYGSVCCFQRYGSDTPRNLADSRVECVSSKIDVETPGEDDLIFLNEHEHPFEMMAYTISSLLSHGRTHGRTNTRTIHEWMVKYF